MKMLVRRLLKLITICIFIFIIFPVTVSADMGPKPFVIVNFSNAEDMQFTATLIAERPSGPGITYEKWLEGHRNDIIDFHPIMEYEDSDGFKWVGLHQEITDGESFKWNYRPPNPFKILIMTSEGKFFSSEVLTRYAFETVYNVDLSKVSFDEELQIGSLLSITKGNKITSHLLPFLLRLVLTIAIELGVAFLFGFRSRRHITIILIVNAITQVLLNVGITLAHYHLSLFFAFFLYIFAEVAIIFIEGITYVYLFKDDKNSKSFLYSVVANVMSFGLGFGTLLLFDFIV